MATREEICATCDQYIALLTKGDTEGIVALYDPNARVEDPLGTEPKYGHEAIRGFYSAVAGVTLTATRLGPVTVVGHEAAFQFRIDVPVGEDTISMVTTDLMTFDESGKVISMKAYADADARPGT
ncbi:MAG TPA: nuclear transport factor 2 family protein [Frankiaceae bacterium]|jgi:steroid delta-isomerase|nr:nuclear transport factor 2 family protein [Frankiaceae bacterium]